MPKVVAADGPGARVPVLSRTTIELRDRLEGAAAASGRSLSQEVERRLERSFDFDFLMGDSETALIMRALGTIIQRFEQTSGRAWTKDSATHEVAYEAAAKALEILMKPDPRLDDRKAPTDEGIAIDWTNDEFRVGLRLHVMRERLQDFINAEEQELIRLRPSRRPRAS